MQRRARLFVYSPGFVSLPLSFPVTSSTTITHERKFALSRAHVFTAPTTTRALSLSLSHAHETLSPKSQRLAKIASNVRASLLCRLGCVVFFFSSFSSCCIVWCHTLLTLAVALSFPQHVRSRFFARNTCSCFYLVDFILIALTLAAYNFPSLPLPLPPRGTQRNFP